MSLKYDTIYINEIIYIGEYLNDGLTKNIYKVKLKNPKGCAEVAKVLCCEKACFKIKIKNMIKYICYSLLANISVSTQIKNIKYKVMYLISFFPALLFKYYVIRKGR